jgi:hypothetical protein
MGPLNPVPGEGPSSELPFKFIWILVSRSQPHLCAPPSRPRSSTSQMQDGDIIELSGSDSEGPPLKRESKEITLVSSELPGLSATLIAKSKPATEQSKELNKLRKENQLLKNERDIQKVEIARLQDELKTILLQLDDRTVRATSQRSFSLE